LADKYGLDVSEISTVQKEKAPSVPVAAIDTSSENQNAPEPVAAPEGGDTSVVVDDTAVVAKAKKTRKPRAKKSE